jgi:2-C-methyl-D-erythritol 2,4-cyclodiphosphate synthase
LHQALFLAFRCNQIDMRIGSGYDVHRLVEGRDLIIGGVKIPYEKGLLGHSDADVLTHAIMDSLLGAAALGDIGKHFPDTDSKYKGASSLVLLERVKELLEENFYLIENIDATIIAQQPKMAPHIEAMRENISKVLGIDLNQINIKATTEEGLGFTGEGQGISSNSICLLTSVADYRYDERTRVFGEESSSGCSGCSGCSKNR